MQFLDKSICLPHQGVKFSGIESAMILSCLSNFKFICYNTMFLRDSFLRILQILKHALHYLNSCLIQLLRAMFGINALSQPELIQNSLVPPCLAVSHVTLPPQVDQMQALDESLYHSCFVYPLVLVAQSLEKLKLKEEVKEKGKGTEALGYTVYFYYFAT